MTEPKQADVSKLPIPVQVVLKTFEAIHQEIKPPVNFAVNVTMGMIAASEKFIAEIKELIEEQRPKE